MRRLLAAICAALTIAALATACGNTGSSTPHGTVTAKDHEPARTTWARQPKYRHVCSTTTRRSGKKTRTSKSCRDVRNGTKRVYHRSRECWGLDLSTGDHVCVTAAKWIKTRVGDHI